MSGCGDLIVVGSGPSAVHAAYATVKSGQTVTMLDVGYEDMTYERLIPNALFSDLRRTDFGQHRYFLGNEFEGIPFGPLGAGPQVTPPRQYVLRPADALAPIVSSSFNVLESLAVGGLGGAWGAGAFPFLDSELAKCSLTPDELRPHYEVIAKRIGISGCQDDLEPLRGSLEALLPPLEIDQNAEMILSRYEQHRAAFHGAGVYMGRPVLAVLTRPFDGREAHPYHDMDFWSNKGGSVYRPDWTVRELQRHQNFSYRRPYLVETFREEQPERVSVRAKSLESGREEIFAARRVILSAGTLGTTRIVLRSLNQYDVAVPLTCNAHTYVPCLHYPSLGKAQRDRRHSLAQLTMIYDPTGNREHLVQAQLFSYRSLLLFRLLREAWLPYRESLRIIRALSPSLVIFVVQFEDFQSPGKCCVLRRRPGGDGDYLEIRYEPSTENLCFRQECERVLMRHMRKLGCWPIKAVQSGHGSSAHYASPFSISREDIPLTTEPSGRLHGTRSVYIADGAVLPYLPAKGLTLTLMANANRIGHQVLRDLSGQR